MSATAGSRSKSSHRRRLHCGVRARLGHRKGRLFYLCDDLPATEWCNVSTQGVRNRCYRNLKQVLKSEVMGEIFALARLLHSSN